MKGRGCPQEARVRYRPRGHKRQGGLMNERVRLDALVEEVERALEAAPDSKALVQRLFQEVSSFVEDLATLNVRTYVLKPDGSKTLAASTEIHLDGDIEAAVPAEFLGRGLDEEILRLHGHLVGEAQANRREILKALLEMFSIRIPGLNL